MLKSAHLVRGPLEATQISCLSLKFCPSILSLALEINEVFKWSFSHSFCIYYLEFFCTEDLALPPYLFIQLCMYFMNMDSWFYFLFFGL